MTGERGSAADPVLEPEEELIVLVDEQGQPTGTAEKWSSHHADTPLHLAFSCYVFDDTGAFLTTRRALTKKVWPGVWTNSFCGHPAPGEVISAALHRRVRQELGVPLHDLRLALPDFRYRAVDASASVPEFANRSSSIDGNSRLSFSATRVVISVGKPNWLPRSRICRSTDRITAGGQ